MKSIFQKAYISFTSYDSDSNSDAKAGKDGALIPISALQHMLYCPRQCALIHIERQWAENRYTAEGRILHEHTDMAGHEFRKGVRIERSVPVRSLCLGISGVADIIELRDGEPPYLVEYKRGRPKGHRADEVQLCAQALCLEEMMNLSISKGALFYGKNRRRQVVVFDAQLRALTEQVIVDTGNMLTSGNTPAPRYLPQKCNACSLQEICSPRQLGKHKLVAQWIAKEIQN